MPKVKTLKAAELIMDWSLWPRHTANDLDSTNLARIKEAILAKINLPPIIVDAKTLRIVDGMHRLSSYMKIYGEDVDVEVELRQYKNEAEIFLDAVRLNSQQGLPLEPKDKAHAILVARKKRIPWPVLAQALGKTVESTKEFIEKRSATAPGGEKIPIPNGAKRLAGKTLTKEEYHEVKTTNGMLPIVNIRMLLNALKGGAFKEPTEKELGLLNELFIEISRVVERRKAA